MAKYLRYNVSRSLFSREEQIDLRNLAVHSYHSWQIGDYETFSAIAQQICWLCVQNFRTDLEYGGKGKTAEPAAVSTLTIIKR